MLILTADVANHVRGLTVLGHALAPKPLLDGTFALPEDVLNDQYHQIRRDYLIANADIRLDSTIDPGTPEFPNDPGSPIIGGDWSQDPVLLESCSYNSSWPVGQLVVVNP